MRKKLYVASSRLHGRGVFAGQNFKKGEIVFIIKGKIRQYKITTLEDAFKYPNAVGIDKDTWIDPRPPFVYLNHSCEPNLGTIGKVTFIALRNIKAGEELTFDYSISEDSPWFMKCNCGSRHCRKTVTGIRQLPYGFYRTYLPYVPRYFQKVYERHLRAQQSK